MMPVLTGRVAGARLVAGLLFASALVGAELAFILPAQGVVAHAHIAGRQATTSTRYDLADVSAVGGTSDAWALGVPARVNQSAVLRFDGTKWIVVAKTPSSVIAPFPGAPLTQIASVSARRAWVVGITSAGSGPVPYLALVSHGSLHRSKIASVRAGGLLAISAAAANDVWAVGYRSITSSTTKPLALRWNGRSWKPIPPPTASNLSEFQAVSIAGSKSVWALAATPSFNSEVLHWNGRRWHVSMKAPATIGLNAIAAASAKDVWVAGNVINGTSAGYIAHWNGQSWHPVATPKHLASLNGIVLSGRTGWMAGQGYAPKPPFNSFPIMLHLVGTTWKPQAVPYPRSSPSDLQSEFTAISMASSRFIIAVGDNDIFCTYGHGFADVYNGHRWHLTALPPKSAQKRQEVPACGG